MNLKSQPVHLPLSDAQNRVSQQQQLLGSDVATLQDEASDQFTDNLTHRLDVNGQATFSDGHDLRVRGNLNVGSSSMTRVQSHQTTGADGGPVNSATSSYDVEGDDLGGSGRLTWRKRLAENGRSLIAEAWGSLSEPKLLSDLTTTTTVGDRLGIPVPDVVVQEQSRFGRTFSQSQRLALTQPLGTGRVLELFGEHRAIDEEQTQSVFDVGGGTPVFNDVLSSAFERTYRYLRGGFRFNRTTQDTRFVLGLQVQGSNLDGVVLDRDETVNDGYTHLLPTADLRVQFDRGKNLNIRYTTSTREPSMTELQPFADNTNPISTYVGNPNLSPEYRHTVHADYRFFDQFTFVNVFTFLRFQYTDNPIVQSRLIDDEAFQVVTPVNIDRSWSTNAGINFGRPVRRLGARVELDYAFGYTSGTELLNLADNESRVVTNSIDLRIENRAKEVFDIRAGARLGLNDVDYSLNDELDQSYFDRTYYGSGTLYWRESWTFSSSFSFRVFDQDVFGNGSDNVALWEASVSKLMMNDRTELQLVAFDLLNQNQGVTYTNGASFIQEQRVQSLGRYLMLKVQYRLGSSGMFGGGRR